MRNLKKMLLGAVAAMALVAGVAVSPASATVPRWRVPSRASTTQNANVPVSRLAGEHVRLGLLHREQ